MLTLYRVVKVLFLVLAILLVWAIMNPESGIAPPTGDVTPAPAPGPSSWSHIQTWSPSASIDWSTEKV